MPRHAIHLGTAWEPPTTEAKPWMRRFGRPTGVGETDRLLLVCEGVAEVAAPVWRTATLNDRPLAWRDAGPGLLECDVTAVLTDRNLLAVMAAPPEAPSGRAPGARATLPSTWGRLSLVVVSD
jgi:hypothetical protein